MPETAKERRERLMGGAAVAPVEETAQQRRERLMGGTSARATPEQAAVARSAIFGDVADENVVAAEEADKVGLLERTGTRRMAKAADFPLEAFGTMANRDPETIARKQAEFDAPAVAELEKQTGPIKTKADVRRVGDVADVRRALALYKQEHPTHPQVPEQYRDPAEARRFLDEAPERQRARDEYAKSGVRSPLAAVIGSRVARAASFGVVDPESPESVISTPQEREVLAAQDRTATGGERFVTGVAETGAMLLPVARIGGMLASGFRAAGASEAVAATAGNLLAGSLHGGMSEGTVEGAVRSGLYMGGQMGLSRVMRGAAPTAGRYAAAEAVSGATASTIAQLAANGVVDPVQAIADGAANLLFGIGGARQAGKARAEAAAQVKARIAAELQAGKELRVIMAQLRDDADVQAMLRTPDEGPTGDPEAMLAETGVDPRTTARLEGEAEAFAPMVRPAPENRPGEGLEMLAGQEPTSPESRVSVAPVRFPKPSKADAGPTHQWTGTEFVDLPPAKAKYPSESKRYGAEEASARMLETPPVVEPAPTPEAPTVKGGYRWDGENFVVDPGTPEPVAIPKQPKPKKGEKPLPPRDAPLEGTPESRMLMEPEATAAPASPGVAPLRVVPESTSRPGKQGERGAVDVSGVGSAAARGIRKVFGRETQKIRDLGTKSADEFATLLEQADDVRQQRAGPLTRARRKVEVFASRFSGHGAARSLTKPDIVRADVDGEKVVYSLPRGEQIINGKATARSPKETELVNLIEDFWQARGKGFEAVGAMRTDPETGEQVPFLTPKGVWPRIPHQDGIDLMLEGKSDRAWPALVRAVADSNKIPVKAAEKILTKMRDRMIGLSGVSGPETGRVSEAEVFRELKAMPSDIYVRGPMGTRRIHILETDPVTMVRRATDMGTSRMGVIKAMGQNLGDDPKIDDLRRRFISENSGRGVKPTEVWDKAIRMAHGIPKNDPTFLGMSFTASHPAAPVIRGIRSVMNLIKTGKMSNRVGPNLFEWTGAPREFVGLANQARVQLERFRDFFQTGEGREAVARDLERRGAIIDEGLAIPADPSHPFTHATSIARQLIDTASLGRPMESSQEHGFARGADLRLKQMQARKGQGETLAGERDVLRLMQVGIKEAQARKLAYGEGTQAEYDTALRTAMNKVIGANTSQLSRSPLENSRLGKMLWYNSWASMNLRHSARTMLTTIRGVESAFGAGLTPAQRTRRLGAATRTFLSWAAGRTVSNAASTAIISLLTGGTTGLSANISEAKDDLGKFLTKSFLYGLVGGPYAAIVRNAGDNLGKQIEGVATPVAVVGDMIDAFTGSGRYTDKAGIDRLKEIVRTYLPFSKTILTAKAAVTGDTTKLHNDAAEQAYFRWRRESGLYEKSKAYEKEPNEFRAAVSKINDLLEEGKTDAARAEYEKAQSIKAPKGMTLAKSLMDRRLLTIPDMKRNTVDDVNPAEALELMKVLKRTIGDTAYAELEKRDKRIMDFLNTVGAGR